TLLLVTAAAVVLVGRLVAAGDVIGSTISAGAGLAGNPELAASPAAQEATPDAGIVGQPQFRARDPAAAAAGGGGPAARLPRCRRPQLSGMAGGDRLPLRAGLRVHGGGAAAAAR